ncbi:MAG: hypothetical protein JWO08_4726 [Verrucomicrobiaceae bacterium]|nr:hypothetical protein [Verrucomicrobiaceae bacterium]
MKSLTLAIQSLAWVQELNELWKSGFEEGVDSRHWSPLMKERVTCTLWKSRLPSLPVLRQIVALNFPLLISWVGLLVIKTLRCDFSPIERVIGRW